MDASTESALKQQLIDRRARLSARLTREVEAEDLVRLLQEVDSALDRMDGGTYGLCEVCHGELGMDELMQNPLARYCLCDLSPAEQRALEEDIDLARTIQSALLPMQDLEHAGFRAHYRYLPAGPVSGDYCDLLVRPGGPLQFALGDVSGKGIAASLLMAHLNAAFHAETDPDLPLAELSGRINRLLSRSTPATHFATLVLGRAHASGELELCNAGHCAPLLVRAPGRSGASATLPDVQELPASGMPIGIRPDSAWEIQSALLEAGDRVIVYTDGLTEARNDHGQEFGVEPLVRRVRSSRGVTLRELTDACLLDLREFLGRAPRPDDVAILMLERTASNGGTTSASPAQGSR